MTRFVYNFLHRCKSYFHYRRYFLRCQAQKSRVRTPARRGHFPGSDQAGVVIPVFLGGVIEGPAHPDFFAHITVRGDHHIVDLGVDHGGVERCQIHVDRLIFRGQCVDGHRLSFLRGRPDGRASRKMSIPNAGDPCRRRTRGSDRRACSCPRLRSAQRSPRASRADRLRYNALRLIASSPVRAMIPSAESVSSRCFSRVSRSFFLCRVR